MKWMVSSLVQVVLALFVFVLAWDHYDKRLEAQTKIEELSKDLKALEDDMVTGGAGVTLRETHDTWTMLLNKHVAGP